MFLCPKNTKKININIINLLRKYFSSTKYKSHNKDKKLNDFFRLPKHEINQDSMHDPNLEEEVSEKMEKISALKAYKSEKNEFNIDRQDLINRQLKLQEQAQNSDCNKFFANSTEQETIKLSQNLIQRLRLKKEFSFNQEFKQK